MIRAACLGVLRAADPEQKCAAAAEAYALALSVDGDAAGAEPLPDRPARPDAPRLVPPGEVPRRRLGSVSGRIALLHALAHIEFNAVDLAFDMAARFSGAVREAGLDARAFALDWIRIGAEEAAHFRLVASRLAALGAAYGDLAAHDGLWAAAERTRHDVLARLAIAPMVLEARGLDVTPAMADRLSEADDAESAAVVRKIFEDEIGHVAAGVNWFDAIARVRGEAPRAAFRRLVENHFAGGLKPPFNDNARARAGLPRAYYDGACP